VWKSFPYAADCPRVGLRLLRYFGLSVRAWRYFGRSRATLLAHIHWVAELAPSAKCPPIWTREPSDGGPSHGLSKESLWRSPANFAPGGYHVFAPTTRRHKAAQCRARVLWMLDHRNGLGGRGGGTGMFFPGINACLRAAFDGFLPRRAIFVLFCRGLVGPPLPKERRPGEDTQMQGQDVEQLWAVSKLPWG